MTAISFTVPGKPVSVNRTYKRGRSSFYKTTEAKQYAEWVGLMAKRAMERRLPMDGHVEVRLGMFLPTQRQDIDSGLKGFLDAMQGIVYRNDSQIRRLIVDKTVDQDRPRVEVAAMEIMP